MHYLPRRITALLLVLCLSLSFSTPAFAVEEDMVLQQVFGTSDEIDIADQALEELLDTEEVPADAAQETPETDPEPSQEDPSAAPEDDTAQTTDPAEEEPEEQPGEEESDQQPDAEEGGEQTRAEESSAQPEEEVEPDPEPLPITGVKASYTIKYGSKLTLAPEAGTGGALSFETSDKTIATVSDKGVVTPKGIGSCTITVIAAATETYPETRTETKVTVQKQTQTITLPKTTITKKFVKGNTFSLGAKASAGGKLTYKSSNTAVATVTAKGKVKMKKSGKVTITIKAAKTDTAKAASAVTVTISLYHRAKSLSPSSSYRSGKYYKALMALKLSGTARANMLAIAKSQIGYHESNSSGKLAGTSSGGSNYTEFGRYYGYNGVPWCAIFVNWCARENGVSTSVIPKYCAVRDYYSFYHRKGQHYYTWSKVRQQKYTPRKGDLILYSNTLGGTTHHIGYVLKATYTKKYVTLVTVEGNTSDQVKKVTMKMSRSSTSGKTGGHYINGIAAPKY